MVKRTDQFYADQFARYSAFMQSWLYHQFINCPLKILGVFTGNKYGKCLREDSLVLKADGSYVKIKGIKKGDMVLSLNNELKTQRSKVLGVVNSGKQKTFTVKTRAGREISASEIHPYLTVNGWRQVKDLKIGDYVATPRKINIENNYYYSSGELWEYQMLGYLLGDGGISQKSVRITNVDNCILSEISSIVEKEGYVLKPGNDKITYRISKPKRDGKANYYVDWLRNFGLMGKTSHTKFIPDFVFSSSNKMIAELLSRLFSCDGWVDKNNVGYCSVSGELIKGVQRLLLRFGITAFVKEKWVNYEYKGKKSKKLCYNLNINRIKDIGIFTAEIGIFSKNDKLLKLCNKKKNKISKEMVDTVPVDIKVLYNKIPEITKAKKIKRSKGKYYGSDEYNLLREARGKTITREKLGVIADVFKEDYLEKLSESDIFWDKIVEIKDDGINQTYDLEIQGTHNFIANDIFVHNTYLAARNYCDRIFGVHGVPRKNVLYFKCNAKDNGRAVGHEFSPKDMRTMFPHVGHVVNLDGSEKCPEPDCGEPIHEVKRVDRVFRFASACLPMQGEDIYHRKKGAMAMQNASKEIKNVQHPAFRKLIPPYLVLQDCTTRSAQMIIDDPHCRGPIQIEFTSYKQSMVDKTGQNRMSCWYDEQASEEEVSDGRARVVLEKGDQLLTCTPIDFTSFYFNEVFEQAKIIYRTKTIVDFLLEEENKVYPQIEHKDSNLSIGVFWAATDDNTLIDIEEIEDLLMTHDDPIMNKIKRYGLFKQISGRIFPQYDGMIHPYQGNEIFNPFAMVN